MKLNAIQVGRWYETTLGVGECLRVGGTHPPSVKVRIDLPLPRGVQFIAPRDVKKEVPKPEGSS